jgi:putative SOS response-associated peptidase YedK
MCCRYVLLQEHAKSFLEQLGVLLAAGTTLPATRYNIPPGGRIPAVRNLGPTAGRASAPSRELTSLHWGLTPSWARTADAPVVNARAESLADKPTFRDAYRARRCLIPASGFYEWKISGRTREPWLFRLRDEQPFAFAALWESWQSPDGTAHESCAIITTAPNTVMAPIHHRMPAILTVPAWNTWLDPQVTSTSTLTSLLAPTPSESMTAVAVTPHVNKITHDDASCLAPAATELQLGLFP